MCVQAQVQRVQRMDRDQAVSSVDHTENLMLFHIHPVDHHMRLIIFCGAILDVPAHALIVIQADLIIAVGNYHAGNGGGETCGKAACKIRCKSGRCAGQQRECCQGCTECAVQINMFHFYVLLS